MGSCLGGVAAAENVTRFVQVPHVPAMEPTTAPTSTTTSPRPGYLGNVCAEGRRLSRPSAGKDWMPLCSVSQEATGAERRFIIVCRAFMCSPCSRGRERAGSPSLREWITGKRLHTSVTTNRLAAATMRNGAAVPSMPGCRTGNRTTPGKKKSTWAR